MSPPSSSSSSSPPAGSADGSGSPSWIDRHADPALQRIAERGIEVDCPNRAVVGFPFALRVACGETAVAERSTGTHADLAGATGGASVFHPMTAKIALQSPVRVESPLLNGPVELRWTDAAVDVGLGMNGPKDVAFDASDLLGAFTLPGYPEQTVAATSAKARLAPSPDGGSTVALTFTDLAFTSGGTRFPAADRKRECRAFGAAARACCRTRRH